MGLNKALASAPWRIGDASSRLLLDVAAGRPVELHRPLTDDEMELASHHGLIGMMADHENRYLREQAVALYARLAARQGVMRTHLRRILTELHDAGIQATVLKGLHLAEWAYANPVHRTTTDIDLLVPADQVERTLEILEGDEVVQTIPPKTPKADKRNILLADDSGMRFTLDLHWDLFSYTQLRGCADGATNWAWSEATFNDDHPLGPMWVLPEEARIAFLCTHALLDHRFRLILFRDLAEVAATDPNWDALVAFAERWKLRSTTYLTLLMAVGLIDASVPHRTLEALRSGLVVIPYLERVLPRTDIVRFDGHRLHPLNLAAVLVHDDRAQRLRLVADAPLAFPHWWKRVGRNGDRVPALAGDTPTKSLLLLVASDRRRGAEVFGERLADGLRDKGWNVDFVAIQGTHGPTTVRAIALSDSASSHRVDRRSLGLLRARIQRTAPSIVLANGGATLRYAVLAMTGLRKRPKLIHRSIGEPVYWLRTPWHRVMQAILYRQADLVAAVSMVTREQLISLFRLSSLRVTVAYVGVPRSLLGVPEKLPSESLKILFLGNLSVEKGPHVALDVFDELLVHSSAYMRYVGTGPMQATLERLAETRGLLEYVDFAGSVTNVLPHLAWADLLLLTSETEGFPGVVLEAAATGTPTVAFAVGGTGETIVDGVTGVVVPAGDTAALVSALVRLTKDSGQVRKMGESARARVQDQFLIEHAVARYDELLTKLLGVEPHGDSRSGK